MTFEPGQKIGAYRIIRLLGEGGMGAVYEVEHEQLGVRYALKAFTAQSGATPNRSKFRERRKSPAFLMKESLKYFSISGVKSLAPMRFYM